MNELFGLYSKIASIMQGIIAILFTLGTIAFLWGVIKYLFSSDPEKIGEARTFIIYGIITLAVMVAAWGIVRIFVWTFFGPTADLGFPLPNIFDLIF